MLWKGIIHWLLHHGALVTILCCKKLITVPHQQLKPWQSLIKHTTSSSDVICVTIEDGNSEHLISHDELSASINCVNNLFIFFKNPLWKQLCQSPLERLIRYLGSVSSCWPKCGFAFALSVIVSTEPHLNCYTCLCLLVSPIFKKKIKISFFPDSKNHF